jgi:hypothetical protein
VRGAATPRPEDGVLLLSLAHDGRLTNPRALEILQDRLATSTDCFLFCPGWLADHAEARAAAARFCSHLDEALLPLRERIVPLRVIVHWPSKPFDTASIENGGGEAECRPQIRGGLGELARRRVGLLPQLLGSLCEAEVPLGPEEEIELDALVRQVRDGVSRDGSPIAALHALSFWLTKRRAGQVGDRLGRELLAPILEGLGPKAPRLHLIGHSFGAKLLTSTVLAGVRPESLVLLLAAFSAFAFAEEVPHMERPGTYRRVVSERLVAGPIVALRSDHDRALGTLYPASIGRDQVDRVAAAGGRHGRTRELVARSAMGVVGARGVGAPELELLNALKTGLPRCVVNIDGSRIVNRGDPLIGAHCDVYRDEIATLVLLAGGLLRGGPAGARPRPVLPFSGA